jgi:YD repeat-containing protein
MAVSQSYDPVGNNTGQQSWSASGTALLMYTATYDAVRNRLTMVELDGTRSTFSYDATYQLINEQRSGTNAYNTSYQYDAVGNRVVVNDSGQLTTSSYNAANELLLATPLTGQPTTTTWDAKGNCLQENAGGALTTYTWDFENRLTSVSSPN